MHAVPLYSCVCVMEVEQVQCHGFGGSVPCLLVLSSGAGAFSYHAAVACILPYYFNGRHCMLSECCKIPFFPPLSVCRRVRSARSSLRCTGRRRKRSGTWEMPSELTRRWVFTKKITRSMISDSSLNVPTQPVDTYIVHTFEERLQLKYCG